MTESVGNKGCSAIFWVIVILLLLTSIMLNLEFIPLWVAVLPGLVAALLFLVLFLAAMIGFLSWRKSGRKQ